MLPNEWLSSYKKSCGNDCVLRLSRTPALQDICLAWRNCTVNFANDVSTSFAESDDKKSQAWESSDYSYQELSDKSGQSVGNCKNYMQQAISLDLIFPDGSLNPAAEKLLSAIIAKSIREVAR